MLLVFSALPGWEQAALHLTMQWGKCALLQCLGNRTERKTQFSKVISVRTCEDSHTLGRGRIWSWEEGKLGECL